MKQKIFMVGAALWIIGSCVLGLRAFFKKHVRIIREPKEKVLFSHVKVLVNFQLIENPHDKYDMEDILNTALYDTTGWIIITHRITKAILLETLAEREELEDYNFDDFTDDELVGLLSSFTCADADIVEKKIKGGPSLYAAACYEDIKILDEEGDNEDDLY